MKTLKIASCDDCPFMRDPDPYPMYCTHPDDETRGRRSRPCPLKKEPLLIELAEDANVGA